MARDDRRENGRDNRYGDNNNDRGGFPNNNFDKNYDSSSYNVRGGRNFEPRDDSQNDRQDRNYPRDDYREQQNGRAYPRDDQSPRNSDARSYRPIEDMQMQERNNMREQQSQPQTQQPIINVSGASDILVSYPKSYQEVKQLIDSLRAKQAVIIDIIKLEPDDAQRVLDFMSGANYALCGSMQRLNTTMFVFTPGGVSIKIPYDIDKKKK